MKNKCKFKKRDGKRCENYVWWKSSDYCFSHSINQKIPLQKKLSFYALLLTIIAIIVSFIFFSINQESQQKILNMSERIENKIEKMEILNRIKEEELKKIFPLGYAFFAVDYKDMIPFIPHESPIHNRFEIDWKPGKIFEVTEETIGIMSPAIYDKNAY